MTPPQTSLYITANKIGGGMFLQHAFSTIIAAREIGTNCWINQQVTVGYLAPGQLPTIGNNVFIGAGAKVLGDITIGDGAKIGANAVVLCDVPAGATAVGVPAVIQIKNAQSSTDA
ncbi:serine O-acetyltransferase [Cerasicoccus arenae]|uniref:Serine acetyltransferase n=1 Tax=Cerasicoccus arenae TaxID=424488 RepID=A0A8J3GDA6_9BACT|nr:hypothetical protein [Cerasicoccus arenae]MBK1857494.1 hypothetical protein [Cerasicoccus arenae]GHB95346.1 hypothetical protein GCM10007047_08830 [Cerasicoccus arenae]